MATRTNWKELYQDLPENIAKVLREKRVKPEQLTAKTDGELLALGLSDADLETTRAKYKTDISQQPTVVSPAKQDQASPDKPVCSTRTNITYASECEARKA